MLILASNATLTPLMKGNHRAIYLIFPSPPGHYNDIALSTGHYNDIALSTGHYNDIALDLLFDLNNNNYVCSRL